MYLKYRDKGVAFLSVDVAWDREGPAKEFVEKYHLTLPVGRDADAQVGTLYGVESTPTTFYIGKDGKLVERVSGAPEDVEAIKNGFEYRIEKLLAG
jgi:peroxiredoxin